MRKNYSCMISTLAGCLIEQSTLHAYLWAVRVRIHLRCAYTFAYTVIYHFSIQLPFSMSIEHDFQRNSIFLVLWPKKRERERYCRCCTMYGVCVSNYTGITRYSVLCWPEIYGARLNFATKTLTLQLNRAVRKYMNHWHTHTNCARNILRNQGIHFVICAIEW